MQIFLNSIFSVFKLLTEPLVLFIFLSVSLLNALFTFAINRALKTQTNAQDTLASLGCLGQIISVFFQGSLVAFLVLFVLPYLFSKPYLLNINYIENFGVIVLKSGILAVLLVSLLSFIPKLGHFFSSSPALEVFFTASVIYLFVLPDFTRHYIPENSSESFFSSSQVWLMFLYLILLFIVSKLLLLTVLLFNRGESSLSSEKTETTQVQSQSTFFNQVLGPSLDWSLGLLFFLLYSFHIKS